MLRAVGSRGAEPAVQYHFPQQSPSACFGKEKKEEESLPSGLSPGAGESPDCSALLGGAHSPPTVCVGDKLLTSPTSALGDRELEGRKPPTWYGVGCGHPHRWAYSVDTHHLSLGTYQPRLPERARTLAAGD